MFDIFNLSLLPYLDRVFDNLPADQKLQWKSFCETHQGILGKDLLPLQREEQSQMTRSSRQRGPNPIRSTHQSLRGHLPSAVPSLGW